MSKDNALQEAINIIEQLAFEYGNLLDGEQDYGLLPSEINPLIIKAYNVKRYCLKMQGTCDNCGMLHCECGERDEL